MKSTIEIEEVDDRYIFEQGAEEDSSNYIKIKSYSIDPDAHSSVKYYRVSESYESMGF